MEGSRSHSSDTQIWARLQQVAVPRPEPGGPPSIGGRRCGWVSSQWSSTTTYFWFDSPHQTHSWLHLRINISFSVGKSRLQAFFLLHTQPLLLFCILAHQGRSTFTRANDVRSHGHLNSWFITSAASSIIDLEQRSYPPPPGHIDRRSIPSDSRHTSYKARKSRTTTPSSPQAVHATHAPKPNGQLQPRRPLRQHAIARRLDGRRSRHRPSFISEAIGTQTE